MGVFLANNSLVQMDKITKQYIIIFSLLLLLSLPNILFVLVGKDSAVINIIKQIAFLIYSLSLVLIFLNTFKLKLFFKLLIPLLPFALLDIFVIKITGTQSTPMHYYSFFATNISEALELISGNLLFVIFAVLYFVIYLLLISKVRNDFKFNKYFSRLMILSSSIVAFTFLVRDVKMAYSSDSNNVIRDTSAHFFIKLNKTFPLGSISKLFGVYEGIKMSNKFEDNTKDFSYQTSVIDDINKTIVLVIGETARKNNFQIYGYERETNPLLVKEPNLIVFSDFTTCANYTQTSVPLILSSVGPSNFDDVYNELGICEAFSEAGFSTYWITNQSYGMGSIYKMFSNSSDFYVDVSKSLEMNNNDLVNLPLLNDILEDDNKKRLIVIHTIGSHYRYNLRYPKEFSKYKPELDNSLSASSNSSDYRKLYVNTYDNSILFTDFFLFKLIEELKESKDRILMMYLSDHGENLYDDDKNLFLHGTAIPSKYELEIPMFVWTSNNFNNMATNKMRSIKNEKLSSEIVFHTLSSLGGFKTKLHKERFDLLSDSVQIGNRTFLKADGSVMNID